MTEKDADTNDELIKRVLAGESSALEEFLLRNYEWLENYINSKIPPKKRGVLRSEDVIQDVYLKAFRSIDSYQPAGRAQLFSWLQTIARNTLFDEIRKRKREKVALEADMSTPQENPELQNLIAELAVDDDPRASQCARTGELHQAFRVALGTLQDDYRRVIELLYVEQQTIDKVAEELGKTVDAVRGIRTRARRQLREALVRLSRYV